MNRRTFVVLLGAIAGCNATPQTGWAGETQDTTATRTSTAASNRGTERSPTDTKTPEQTPTATATETETERPEPTATETPEPSDAERRGARAIERTKRELTDTVEILAEGYGSELTDITAASTDFPQSPHRLRVALADAQQAYIEAQSATANEEQARLANRLGGCWQFLDDTRTTQEAVVTTYSQVAAARDAFERVAPEAGKDAASAVDTTSKQAATRYRSLDSNATVEAATAVDAISETEYRQKLAQLDADVGVLQSLSDTLADFAEGVRLLQLARVEFERDGRDISRAADLADRARNILASVSNTLSDMINNAGEHTTLVPMLKSLRSVASNKAEAAGDLD